MAEYLIQSETLKSMADKIRVLNGVEGAMTPAQMDGNLGEVNVEVDEQAELIEQIASALEGKAGSSGVNVVSASYQSSNQSIPFAIWFEDGMTWEEYLNSRYNIRGYYLGEPYYVLFIKNNKLQPTGLSYNYMSVDGTSSGLVGFSDKIIADKHYICYFED